MKWIRDENSLTESNNCIAIYRDQNRALSLVSIHTINILLKNGLNKLEEINFIATSLYYWFIKTIVERPEYINESWQGARIFYLNYFDDIDPFKLQLEEWQAE